MRAALLAIFMLSLLCGCSGGGKRAGGRVDYASSRNSTVIASSESGEGPITAGCPLGMVLIPAGPALYGPSEEKNVKPGAKEVAQRINMKAFCIDKYEYPNEPGEAPMRSATWVEAKDLCAGRGKRLCTEYEFEKACRGAAGTVYTYGDGFADKACPKSSDEYGLGQYVNCVSGFGVHDMSGGVFEWTSSTVGEDAKTDLRILRGGMSGDGAESTSRCTFRTRFAPATSGRDVGFRCCGALVKEEINK